MNAPELDLLKSRLERVWSPQTYQIFRSEEPPHSCRFEVDLGRDTELRLDVYLDVVFGQSKIQQGYCLLNASALTLECGVTGECDFYIQEEHNTHGYRKVAQIFIDHWMPFFRRGCWLSGFPVEATAHEKAEWMQGFRREELESWNLQF